MKTRAQIELAPERRLEVLKLERYPSARIRPETIEDIRRHVPDRTKKGITSAFAVSLNTWDKIEAGQPIRLSTALRLVERLEALAGDDAAKGAN